MRIDLLHNRIVADHITPRFKERVESELCPKLAEIFGDSFGGILMYEDYLAEDFLVDGEWYYPFTVYNGGRAMSVFVKWAVDSRFKGGCPYAFVGDGELGFTVVGVSELPAGISEALEGRAIDYDTEAIRVRVVGATKDAGFLVGKYSQTFVDEMARQISQVLTRVLSVRSVAGGTLELQLVIAPDTYMEHTSENVTYRRLLLTDKGCQPRDFWIKWTRLDSGFGFTVKDLVTAETISFDIGEDVPQKIREKEFRFLCRANPDKYQSAMGKRTVTEWRELIKRSIKRGELEKIEVVPAELPKDDLDSRLKAVVGDYEAATAPEVKLDDSDITRMALAALGEDAPVEEIDEEPVPVIDEDEAWMDEDVAPAVWTPEGESTEDAIDFKIDIPDEPEMPEEAFYEDEPEAEEVAVEVVEEVVEEATETTTSDEEYRELERLREERIRREVEARLRLEYETEARVRAEAEAEKLRLERERLREENERLRKEAEEREAQRRADEERRKAEEAERLEAERIRREEEERRRIKMAEQARAEEEERARLAEIARRAIEEQARLDRERIEREARERIEAERRERERLERERAEREAEIIKRELARKQAEEEARRRAQPTFVTKHAKLIFRRSVDLNVIKRIKEIVEETLVVNNKAHIHIYMKAYPIDSYTINLDMKLPDTEGELLVAIVKAIGNGHLGITKIIVE